MIYVISCCCICGLFHISLSLYDQLKKVVQFELLLFVHSKQLVTLEY